MLRASDFPPLRGFPLLLLLTLAAALRAPVLRSDLWLDEAWSYQIAEGCQSLADIWSDPRNHVDNNHPVMTAWIMIVGPTATPAGGWLYRLPAFLAGLASIALAYKTVGRLPALWLTLALPFTIYATEARGYAPALAAMMGCLYLLKPEFTPNDQSQIANRKSQISLLHLLLYWLTCALGLWSHFTFIHILAGLLFIPRTLKRTLAYHIVPLATVALTYLLFVRHLKIAGGPPTELRDALTGMASLLAGGPERGWLAYVTAASVILPFAFLAIANFKKDRLTRAALIACLAALATLLIKHLQFGRPEVLFPRYFLLAATLAGLVLAKEVATQYTLATAKKQRPLQLLFATLAVVTLTYATLDSIRFTLTGRGQYLAPLQLVSSSTEPSLTSEYDSRTQRLIAYYRPWLENKIFYIDSTTPGAPRWLLRNTGTHQAPAPYFHTRDRTYKLQKIYPATGPSGWSWQLYERQ